MSAIAATSGSENSQKPHLGIVIVGHVDAGKSTTTGHLLFKLGGLKPRILENLKAEAASLGKQSFEFAFFMDKQKEYISTGLNFLIGHLYGFINRKDSYYDLDCNVMHDYENSLKHYLKDGRIIRLNNVACKTKMYAKGGIGNKNDRYEDMENDVMFLMSKYPDMVVPKKKRDGMPHITLKKLPPIFFDL